MSEKGSDRESASTYKPMQVQAKVNDQIHAIVINKFKIMLGLNIGVIIFAIIIIPLASNTEPQRGYTRTIRVTFGVFSLIASILSVLLVIYGFYLAKIHKEGAYVGISSDRSLSGSTNPSPGFWLTELIDGDTMMKALYILCSVLVLVNMVGLGHTAE